MGTESGEHGCRFLENLLPAERVSFDLSRREQFAQDASVQSTSTGSLLPK